MSEVESSFVALAVQSPPKMTADMRRSHCESWSKSGLSMSEYCRRSEVSVSSLSAWAKKFNYTSPTHSKNKPRKMLAPNNVPPRRHCMEIILVSGIRLRFSEIGNMSEILKLLKAIESCN